MKNKINWIVLYFVLTVMLVGVAGGAFFAFRAAGAIRKTNEQLDTANAAVAETRALVNTLIEEEVVTTTEDDVVISSDYVIKSTLPISDAYKSGKKDGLDDKQKETLDMAAAVLDEVIKDNMSDYEKEIAVYDWMTKNLKSDTGMLTVIPTSDADCDNPFGVLKYHSAVCVGYATTFRLFMQMMDIECMVVHNLEMYHSWDLVKLGDGWYHTDIYSDMDAADYSDFNMTANQCKSAGHDWDESFFPNADSLEFSYAYINSTKITDVCKLPKLISKALKKGESKFFLFTGEDLQKNSTAAEVIMTGINDRIYSYATYPDINMSWLWSYIDNNTYLLCVYINKYSDSEQSYDLPEELQQEISDALNEEFGEAIDYYE